MKNSCFSIIRHLTPNLKMDEVSDEVSDEEFIKQQLFIALADAIMKNDVGVVKRLLRLGVDPNGCYVMRFSERGGAVRNPCLLYMCYENRNFKMFKLLVDAGAHFSFNDSVKNICFDVVRRLFYYGDREHASFIAHVFLECPEFVLGVENLTFTDWNAILSPNAPHGLNWSLLQTFTHCVPAFKLLECVKAHKRKPGGWNSLIIQYVYKLAFQTDGDDLIGINRYVWTVESSFITDVSIFSRF